MRQLKEPAPWNINIIVGAVSMVKTALIPTQAFRLLKQNENRSTQRI